MKARGRGAVVLLLAVCGILSAQSRDATLARVAVFQLAGGSQDPTLEAVLSTVAQSVELSLVILNRYDVRRLQETADPKVDLGRVRIYCDANRIDQAILGSGIERQDGSFVFRLLIYDRKSNSITIDRQGTSRGALDMFDTTDSLVASLLDGLSGTHLAFASLRVDTTPTGATIAVNGREIGQGPLSVRGVPVGTLEISAHADGFEDAHTSVTLTDGDKAVAAMTLVRSMGKLSVQVPADAHVQITSSGTGQTERITGPGTLDLPTGSYQLEASSSDLATIDEQVTVERNVTATWAPYEGAPPTQAVSQIPDSVWEEELDHDVVINKTDGTEVSGYLFSVDTKTAFLSTPSGAVITLARDEAQDIRLIESSRLNPTSPDLGTSADASDESEARIRDILVRPMTLDALKKVSLSDSDLDNLSGLQKEQVFTAAKKTDATLLCIGNLVVPGLGSIIEGNYGIGLLDALYTLLTVVSYEKTNGFTTFSNTIGQGTSQGEVDLIVFFFVLFRIGDVAAPFDYEANYNKELGVKLRM